MITLEPRLPANDGTPGFISRLIIRLSEVIRSHANEINKVTKYATAMPTTGASGKGDFIWNANPVESGTAGSKYVVIGWSCVTSGEPGTYVECRGLTGN